MAATRPDNLAPMNAQAREIAARSEQMLGVLFDNSPMPIGMSRRSDGMIVDVNQEWARLTGYSRDEAVGRTATELGIWTDAGARDAIMSKLADSGRVEKVETIFLSRHGQRRELLLDISQIEIGGEAYLIIYHTDVSRQRDAQLALRAGEEALQLANRQLSQQIELFKGMESLAKVGHWVSDPRASGLVWSSGLYDLTGMPPGSVTDVELGRSRIYEEDRAHYLEARGDVDGSIVEYRWHHPDGSVRWLRSRMRRQITASGATVDFAVVQDITNERMMTLALQEKLDFIQAITARTPGIVFQIRRKPGGLFEFPFVSDAVKDIYEVTPEYFMAHPELIVRRQHPDDVVSMVQSLKVSGQTLTPWRHEYRLQFADGRVRWLLGDAVPEREADGSILWTGFATDITDRKNAEEEIQRLAFYDALTGLPNRRLLIDRLQHALAMNDRDPDHLSGALLFIDLDNFKDLNDTLGHDVGDVLLKLVGERIVQCVRSVDTVSRFGGDEFVVMLEKLGPEPTDAAAHVEAVARKILVALNHPYDIGGHDHHSTPSIGIALFQDHHVNVEEVLKRADLAMYQAKAAGRNTLRFFDPAMQAVVAARSALEFDLRQGLLRKELLLHYQPVVNELGVVVGAEALVRWMNPQRGMISPGEFIPLAEATGLILPLGEWVLEQACAQLKLWSMHLDTAHLALAVNVSARQFRQPEFASQILLMLEATGANPARLKLEITESLLVTDVDDAIRKMTELRRVGVRFALDDFGTGYSSLAYLKRLPLEQLKIDQSFVRDVLTDPNDAVIAQTILALGQSLGLTVVAEGVETEGQRNFLLHHGCKVFQGYLFGKPVPIAELHLGQHKGPPPNEFQI
jgi:diguanylate cyclase (GGDEF)-like protein/PAS domain S-box-containing protein